MQEAALDALLPQETPQLVRLRTMVNDGLVMLRSKGHWDAPPQDSCLDRAALDWEGRTLTWKRGATIVQTYTFTEPICAACTAWMEHNGSKIESALCIFLERSALFYFPRLGEEYVQPLYFRLASVFPLSVGLMLLREREPEDSNGQLDAAHEAAPLPSAFYLRNVFDDLTGWVEARRITTSESISTLHGVHTPFPHPDERVVYACGSECAFPILVTANISTARLRVYAYVCASEPFPRTADEPFWEQRKARRSSAPLAHRRSRRSSGRAEPRSDLHVISELAPYPRADALVGLDAELGERRASAAFPRNTRQRRSSLPAHTPPPEEEIAPFDDFVHAHAAVALLDEIHAPALASGIDAAQVHCFLCAARGTTYLYIGLPATSLYCRRLDAHRRGDAMEWIAAVPHEVDAVVSANKARAVHVLGQAAMVLATPAPCLVLGPPTKRVARIPLLCAFDDVQWDKLDIEPQEPLARHLVHTLLATLPADDSSALLRACAIETGLENGYAARLLTWPFVQRLLGVSVHAPPLDPFLADVLNEPCEIAYEPCTPLVAPAPLALVLHFLAMDAMVDLERRAHLAHLLPILQSLLTALGWGTWADFWARRFPDVRAATHAAAERVRPPDVYEIVHACLEGRAASLDTVYAQCASQSGVVPTSIARWCTWSAQLLELYSTLGNAALGADSARRVVQTLLDVHWGHAQLAKLPAGLALPFEEALRTVQLNPPRDWHHEAYKLLRRDDASVQASHAPAEAHVPTKLYRTLPDHELDPLSAQLFPKDYRLCEVARMLQTTRPNSAMVHHDEDRDEPEFQAEVFAQGRALAERTMAQCIGRGMFRMASHALRSTVTWHAPRLCLALRTFPGGGLLDDLYVGDASELAWPEFHNGVASALEMAVHIDTRIESNWIFAHTTAHNDPNRHAGFLLGLGLHGHLKGLGRVHAYRYLTPRHELTTIGLVLGLAASFLGTADPAARQVMAVQITAFLPSGSVPLHFDTLTQAAGLLGMGLVFCATDHRWTAEKLVEELCSPHLDAEASSAMHDVYATSAGLALGFVFLARGRRTDMESPSDAKLLAQLRKLVLGGGERIPANNRASLAAVLAIALIFLRSGRQDVAELLAPPASRAHLDHIRPDLLLFRTLARCLVLWDTIAPHEAFFSGTLAPCMHGNPLDMGYAEQLGWYNMRAGACLALSLRFAGTADAQTRSVLLRQLEYYVDSVPAPGHRARYSDRIVHAARETLRDVLHVALATVMAGTGDVDLLRLYRMAHGEAKRSYGGHMATHMALGLLFLGGCRFTLGRSDVAIAAMLTAFLPRYPSTPSENYAHLQAARHLYILALDPRLLVGRDVRSGDTCFLPVRVHGKARCKLEAPALLPPLVEIEAIESVSRRYWPAALQVQDILHETREARHIHWFHVQRRTGYLSYLDDPHGQRSIFARSRGWAAHPFSAGTRQEAHAVLRDLRELVHHFETAPQYAALVRLVCAHGQHPFSVFCAAVLMDTLTKDTPALSRIFFAFWAGLARGQEGNDGALFLADLAFLDAYYKCDADARLREHREALLEPAVLASVQSTAHAKAHGEVDAYLDGSNAALSRSVAYRLAALGAPLQADLQDVRAKFQSTPRTVAVDVLRQVVCRTVRGVRSEALVRALTKAW
ncbi:Anaphase-promoting complex subunit 1 [Malassezia vespertilionis]|uniref:Apc1p n=1 Tax=Malassezia vespertilionis TaxID=2020962 RepID=A0A2N1JAS7_9BASI|nr:Anaphase-promoting complex subunit 1 [Malassezia vespertilionis]PKI83660.1 Apc1p [Malassezia vespertilionis]WFD07099.1 Anaphase-promoting complex subunit 1 [Malassezia vespertilionis]